MTGFPPAQHQLGCQQQVGQRHQQLNDARSCLGGNSPERQRQGQQQQQKSPEPEAGHKIKRKGLHRKVS